MRKETFPEDFFKNKSPGFYSRGAFIQHHGEFSEASIQDGLLFERRLQFKGIR